jgi:primosomal protein N' (replication factor Y)
VAIQHSAQSPAVRYDLWREILTGRYPVVVGARSAVFSPLKNLGLIVVDEEQETSFKQEEPAPRYHARDAALMRARMENAVAVLGSATPSLESFHLAQSGRYRMLRLPDRVGGANMPRVRLVASRPPKEEPLKDEEKPGRRKKKEITEIPALTNELLQSISETLQRGKQVMLLQNRRGFSPFLVCPNCSQVPMCPNCTVSLTYHQKGHALRCHYCDHREPVPDICSKCGSGDLKAEGFGTQRLEEDLAAHFPTARIMRMDSDSTTRRGAHGKMVSAFAAGEYDLLVGTQMIAKGLDFPGVELAAVVQADTELFYPDFRSSERGAALILQISGRAGRREETGTVIVQTAVPDHPVLRTAIAGDWEEFARNQLKARADGCFPPFARLVLLRALGKDESAVARAMLRLKNLLGHSGTVEVLGPAPAVILKLKNLFRYQLLVRTTRQQDAAGVKLRTAVRQALTEYKQARIEPGVTIEVDVDPQSIT